MGFADRTMLKTPGGTYIAKDATATNPPEAAAVAGMSIVPTFIWDDWPDTVILKAYNTWHIRNGALSPPDAYSQKIYIGRVGGAVGGANQDITLNKSSTTALLYQANGDYWYVLLELCYFNPDSDTRELRWRMQLVGLYGDTYYGIKLKGPTTDGKIGGIYPFYSGSAFATLVWQGIQGDEEIVEA
jgi:hypothetical protein